MPTLSYLERRGELETYFDRTAAEAWSKLTSDAPVGRIRATVRAGRDRMRATLLCLAARRSARGARFSTPAAAPVRSPSKRRRAAPQVVAIDLSPTLVALARKRAPPASCRATSSFLVGDMLDPALGRFDFMSSPWIR